VKWRDAQLGEDLGPYSFRTWSLAWNPKQPGTYQVAVRATDVKGNVQPDEGVWNGGGFLWNKSNDSNLLSETPLSRGKPMNKRAFLRGVVAALAILASTALHAQVQAGNSPLSNSYINYGRHVRCR
jgi:hypothetical protein